MNARLLEIYKKKIVPELKKEFGYANDMSCLLYTSDWFAI